MFGNYTEMQLERKKGKHIFNFLHMCFQHKMRECDIIQFNLGHTN